MERADAVGQLPVTYQCLLTWLEEGRSTAQIATELGIDANAVGPLLSLAEAKLARLTAGGIAAASTDDELPTTGRQA